MIGDNKTTVIISEELKQKGYWVTPVRPPTVPSVRPGLGYRSVMITQKKCWISFAYDLSEIGSEIFETVGV